MAAHLIVGRHKPISEVATDVTPLRESPFWYFLARRALDRSGDKLSRALESLERRATELSLPIQYPRQHATGWAVLLQLFEIATPHREEMGRFGYEMMVAGFDRVFGPNGFSKEALSRLLGNLNSPAFPNRKREETIADTFLANAMRLIDPKAVDPRLDALIMQTCLTDPIMCDLANEAVRPAHELWEATLAEYVRRRPGFIRRQFLDPNSWLFESRE